MENGEVYGATTEAHPGPGRGARSGLAAYFTLSRLSGFWRFKVLELPRTRTAPLLRSSRMSRPPLIGSPSPKLVFFCECNPAVLSLLAFICEEVVSQCTLCGGLYFFEFVSCSAFLLSLLILIVYCTPVYDRVDPAKVKSSDFYITLGTGLVFFVASVIFALTHDNTITEIAAIVFGMLASLAYVADFSFMLREKCKEPQPRKGEAAVRREYLTEPLNA